MKRNDELPRRWRRRWADAVDKDEVLRDSRGRIIDDAYVEGAVEDALAEVAKDRPQDKA